MAKKKAGLLVRTNVKAGRDGIIIGNHNRTVAPVLRGRTGLKEGGIGMNRNRSPKITS